MSTKTKNKQNLSLSEGPLNFYINEGSKKKYFCLSDIPLDTTSISQSLLNIEKKERSNPFPWNGQFSPQLVEVLLQKYASPGTKVLDPFAGSGTILYEAGRANLQAIAVEINPASHIMAKTYCFMNIEHPRRKLYIEELDTALKNTVYSSLPVLEGSIYCEANAHKIKSSLIGLHRRSQSSLYKTLVETLIVRLDFYPTPSQKAPKFIYGDEWEK